MANLKLLRSRIQSIKSIQKITAAMKLVASAHFKRAEHKLLKAYPYAQGVGQALKKVMELESFENLVSLPLLKGGSGNIHLLIIISGNRGLSGAFNMNVSHLANQKIFQLQEEGKSVKLLCLGAKSILGLKREYHSLILDHVETNHSDLTEITNIISTKIKSWIFTKEIGTCSVIYTSFRSLMMVVVQSQTLIPFIQDLTLLNKKLFKGEDFPLSSTPKLFDIEPKIQSLLEMLSFQNLKAQLYFSICESATSEHSSRMIAMDNATKNAKEILEKLEISYNRTRQTAITEELIEIVAGAEAV